MTQDQIVQALKEAGLVDEHGVVLAPVKTIAAELAAYLMYPASTASQES